MSRIKRAPIEVFNIAFLDIISCAFGAVVMLVLLSKNGELEAPPDSDASSISILIDSVLSAQQSVEDLQGALSNKQDELLAAKAKTAASSNELDNLQQKIPRATEALKQLENKAQTIRTDIKTTNAMLNVPASTNKPDKDVGGVPTDADYVVFIIDNSGSMVQIGWDKIIRTVTDVIENHPKLKGFNVMSADGKFLPIKKAGWIEDTKTNRRIAIAELKRFQGGGSTPEVGIIKAIKTFKKTKGKVSLYVFGDEYSARDLKSKVDHISKANWDSVKKRPRFRIHGIGFYWTSGSNTRIGFSAFMKAVAHNNRGAFIALDIK